MHHLQQFDAHAGGQSVRHCVCHCEGLVGLDFDGVDAVAGGFGVCGCARDGEGGVGAYDSQRIVRILRFAMTSLFIATSLLFRGCG